MRYTPAMDQSYTLNNAKVLVMGLGRFGGGLGITRYLLRQGAHVTINDRSTREELRVPLEILGEHPNLTIVLGHHDPVLLKDIDVLVVNPAVPCPWENEFISAALENGINITTEIEIAYRQLNPSNIIAITGSAGKSTTSAMTHHILRALKFPSVLGGNIGGSLLDPLDQITKGTTVVLELSSAMLYWLWGRDTKSPPDHSAVACVTSYNPNHLDWHHDEAHYLACKKSILNANSKTVLPESLKHWANDSTHIISAADAVQGCAVPGQHNAMNAALAIACIHEIHPNIPFTQLIDAVRTFPGLPHRLHRCFEYQGVTYFDDSKSTTPQATLLAVDSLESIAPRQRIHLIVGGYNKGSDLTPIAKLAPDLAGLYCIGTTAPSIVDVAGTNAYHTQTLERAMDKIQSHLSFGDLVLLSPGCASWDQFENYEHRGRRFVELAKSYAGVTA